MECISALSVERSTAMPVPTLKQQGLALKDLNASFTTPKTGARERKTKGQWNIRMLVGVTLVLTFWSPKEWCLKDTKHQALDDDDIFFDGKFSDYISLDVSDDEAGELHHMMCDHTSFGDNDSSDLQLDDLDELIKPIRIMN